MNLDLLRFLVSASELNMYTTSCRCHPLEDGWKRLALDDSRINYRHYLRWVKKLLFSLKKFNITRDPCRLCGPVHSGMSVWERLPLGFQSIRERKISCGASTGGGKNIFPRNLPIGCSDAVQAKWAHTYWQGSGANLRALEALAFLSVKYAFYHFSWYLSFKIFN